MLTTKTVRLIIMIYFIFVGLCRVTKRTHKRKSTGLYYCDDDTYFTIYNNIIV